MRVDATDKEEGTVAVKEVFVDKLCKSLESGDLGTLDDFDDFEEYELCRDTRLVAAFARAVFCFRKIPLLFLPRCRRLYVFHHFHGLPPRRRRRRRRVGGRRRALFFFLKVLPVI